jgi:hypothetical protein
MGGGASAPSLIGVHHRRSKAPLQALSVDQVYTLLLAHEVRLLDTL